MLRDIRGNDCKCSPCPVQYCSLDRQHIWLGNRCRRAASDWQNKTDGTYYPVQNEDDEDDNQMLAYGRASPTSQISDLTIPTSRQ